MNFLNKIFARSGVQNTIVSDNGRKFTPSELAKFCKFYLTEHITTPMYHLRSNTKVERFVDLFKRGLKKINGE